MTEGIIAFQALIFTTILATRFIDESKVVLVCIAWTIFTLVMVYASPLILLQLLVIWGTYALVAPKDEDTTSAPEAVATEQEHSSPLGSSTAELQETSPANKWVQKLELGSEDLSEHSSAFLQSAESKLTIQKAVSAVELQAYPERVLIQSCLDRAKAIVANEKLWASPEQQRQRIEIRAELQAAIGTHEQEEPDKLEVLAAAQFLQPPRHPNSHMADNIERAVRRLKEDHEEFLKTVLRELRPDKQLEEHFWATLNKDKQPLVYESFKSFIDRQKSGAKSIPNEITDSARAPSRQKIVSPPPVTLGDLLKFHAQQKNARPPSPTIEDLLNFQDSQKFDEAQIARKSEHVGTTTKKPSKILRKLHIGTLGIPYLTHFTRVENLPSIMRHGLKSVSSMQAEQLPFCRNDGYRLDGHEDAISLSIGHPNDKLFFRWRRDDPRQRWVVLLLNVSVLWTHDLAFYPCNAADRRASKLDRSTLDTNDAFDALFEETLDGHTTRTLQKLYPYDPTDVQAEVLIFENIPSSLVKGAVFSDNADLLQWRSELPDRSLLVNSDRTGMFGLRDIARKMEQG